MSAKVDKYLKERGVVKTAKTIERARRFGCQLGDCAVPITTLPPTFTERETEPASMARFCFFLVEYLG